MKANLFMFLIGAIIGALILYFLLSNQPSNERIYFKEKVLRDTIIKIVPQKRYIIRSQPKLTVKDTLKAQFTFSLDTLLEKGDTLKINYSYPENTLFVRFASMPDTFAIEHRTLHISTAGGNTTWFEPALYMISGVALGFIVAKIK